MLPAAEAVKALALRVNHERRVAVIVEGAPGNKIVGVCAAQGNVASDNTLDGNQRLDSIHFIVYRPDNRIVLRAWRYVMLFLRQWLGRVKQLLEFFSALSQAHKVVRYVTASLSALPPQPGKAAELNLKTNHQATGGPSLNNGAGPRYESPE
jgi:hypothetical protein